MFFYRCTICEKEIYHEAHGGPKPSAGSHDSAYHVAKSYNTHYFEKERND